MTIKRIVSGLNRRKRATLALVLGVTAAFVVMPMEGAGAVPRPASVQPDISGSLVTTLTDPGDNANQEDDFGASVAVSGTTAIVGSNYVNQTEGAAYIYIDESGSWTLTKRLSAPGVPLGACFGCSVAITGDGGPGTTAVVGAPNVNKGKGAAYVFVEDSTGQWPTKPVATLSKAGASGTSVAVAGSGPGTTVLVGGPEAKRGKGSAFVWVESAAGTWSKKPTVALKDPATKKRPEFGLSVALSGTGAGATAVVGAVGVNSTAGAADIYVEGASPNIWPLAATLSDPGSNATHHDEFGISVSLSGAGSGATAIIGNDASPGNAYIYVEGATTATWPLTATLADPAMVTNDAFGSAVSISGTGPGSTAVVGADGGFSHTAVGTAYVFTEGATPDSWSSITLSDPGDSGGGEYGGAVSVSGPTAIVGSEGFNSFAGAAYIYS
jgi:hypothetical protein